MPQRHVSPAARALTWLALLGGLALYLAPVVFMVVASLKPNGRVLAEAATWRALVPAEVTLANYRAVFERVDFLRFMGNSLLITGAIVVAGLVVNSMAAYALARLRWRGRRASLAVVLALMILPTEAIAVPLFYLVTLLGWRDTLVAQIVPFIANPLAIYLFYSFFLGMPRELEEAAAIDGAGTWRTYWQIVVPNARPAFAAVTIVTVLFFWGFYLWPLIVTSGPDARPLPVAIATFQTLPPLHWGDIMAFGVMMVSPVVVVFLVCQRWFIQGLAGTGQKG